MAFHDISTPVPGGKGKGSKGGKGTKGAGSEKGSKGSKGQGKGDGVVRDTSSGSIRVRVEV